LVIDLSAVTFLASAGVRILVQTAEQLSSRACFAVVASGAATTRPIQLMRLDSMFALHETLDAALAVVSTGTGGRG
jgi:anti-anti-sigma factor